MAKREYRQRELRTIGVGNVSYSDNKRYCLQYYDFDGEFTTKELNKISELFPNDCIVLKSRNGYHFYSLTLMTKRPKKIKRKAFKLSKKLHQDYCTPKNKMKNLVLRIGPKFKNGITVSDRPTYFFQWKFPTPGSLIAKKHLEFFYRFLNLPELIFKYYYKYCNLVENSFNIVYYHTGPIIIEEEVITID